MKELRVIGFYLLFLCFVLGLLIFQVNYFNGLTGFVVNSEDNVDINSSDFMKDSPNEMKVIVEIVSPVSGSSFLEGESFLLDYSYYLDYGVQANDFEIKFESCWYSVDFGKNNISLEECLPKEISLSESGEREIYVYVTEKTSGKIGFSSVLIKVLENNSNNQSNSGNSQTEGSSNSGANIESKKFYDIGFVNVSEIKLKKGESSLINFGVKNIGLLSLTNCVIELESDFSSFVASQESYDFLVGKTVEVSFNLEAPNNFDSGIYDVSLFVICPSQSFETSFILEVLSMDFDFNIVDSRVNGNTIEVDYVITELSGMEHKLVITYHLSDNSEILFQDSENFNLLANSNLQKNLELGISSEFKGEYFLTIKLSSDYETVTREERVVLSSKGFTGLAIFGEGNMSIAGILILAGLSIGIFFVFRHFRKRSDSFDNSKVFGRNKKHFIKLNFKE